MLIRYVVFQGKVRESQHEAMRAYVRDTLLGLWQQFDGAEKVDVMYEVEQDPDGPSAPLVAAFYYPDEAAMARGIASKARYESRDLLPGFFERYLDGRLYHYVMKLED